MAFLIDGHNLIGKIPDLHLGQIDDEEQLIRRLLAFCAARRQTAEIYFDNAAPGSAGRKSFGAVAAIFVPSGQTADAAIRRRLGDLGRKARSYTVVSSDRQVQAEARSARAAVMPSDVFAAQLAEARPGSKKEEVDPAVGPDELDEWLDLFSAGKSP